MTLDHDDDAATAEINITPLADVMLVLLIIFMITAPLSVPAIKVSLPKTSAAAEAVAAQSKPIDLAIRADGDLYLDDAPMSLTDLPAALADRIDDKKQSRVDLRADRTVPFKTVREVVDVLRGNGLAHVNFVTRPGTGNE